MLDAEREMITTVITEKWKMSRKLLSLAGLEFMGCGFEPRLSLSKKSSETLINDMLPIW
jgi:hypothetical protein